MRCGNDMLKIGITGGIGCGKSLVVQMLGEQGIPIISADRIATDIILTHPDVRSELSAEFGPGIYSTDGLLNRSQFADIIFTDESARRKVNAIVHPHVLERQESELKKLEKQCVAIAGVEAALIYEAHAEHQFDYVVVVSAPRKIVIERLQKRDDLTPQEILSRIQSQMPLEEKIMRADYVIHNHGSVEDLRNQVDLFMQWLNSKLNAS